jgi:prepilin-type N-terminal cleavage/methylation domain-containing protein
MLNIRLLCRTARNSSRDGFTLVELLVVIGIIAILAGVALGPITSGIKKAKQNAGLQTVRTIAVAEFAFSNDNNGAYPDLNIPTGNASTGAAAVAAPLIAGNYCSDPTIFYISGGGASKYTGSGTITATQISFDFTGANGGLGVSSNFPDQCPIAWSSVVGGTPPTLTTAAGSALTAVPASGNPFGLSGMAVAYKSNSSKFVIYSTTASNCTLVDTSWSGGVPSGATSSSLQGGG